MNTVTTSVCALALVVFALVGCANLPDSNRRQRMSSGSSNVTPGSSPSKGSWSYSDTEDQMGRGRIHLASVESNNTISLDFPYEGEQHGRLVLRQHPKHGNDVYLTIERGQLLDSEYNSPVVARFDDDRPLSFATSGPSDHSTETLFLRGNAFTQFVNRLKTAKTVRIEAPVYQGGNQVFVFNVEGFSWIVPQRSP